MRNVHATLPAMIPVYRNVRPGTSEHHYGLDTGISYNGHNGYIPTHHTYTDDQGVLHPNEAVTVNWRYITKSAHFVLVRASAKNATIFGNNHWVFIDRKYLPPTYSPNRQKPGGGLCDNTMKLSVGGTNHNPVPLDDDIRNYTSEPTTKTKDHPDWPHTCAHNHFNVPDEPYAP